MDVKTIGIVGAGQMGNGIAHVFALAGYDVLLNGRLFISKRQKHLRLKTVLLQQGTKGCCVLEI